LYQAFRQSALRQTFDEFHIEGDHQGRLFFSGCVSRRAFARCGCGTDRQYHRVAWAQAAVTPPTNSDKAKASRSQEV
jgi:hypothetical protein